MQVHNKRNFSQSSLKLDSETNVLFILNKHSNIYFLSHNSSVHIILFNLKKKKIIAEDIAESVHKAGMEIMTAKTTTIWPLYQSDVHFVLTDVMFRQILYEIIHMLDTFSLVSISLINYASSYRKM